MFLKVGTVVVAHIVGGEQSAAVGGDDSRNTVGRHIVVACFAHAHGGALGYSFSRNVVEHGILSVDGRTCAVQVQGSAERSRRFHFKADPVEMRTFRQVLVQSERHFFFPVAVFGFQQRIARHGGERFAFGGGRQIFQRLHHVFADRGRTACAAVVEFQTFDVWKRFRVAPFHRDFVHFVACLGIDFQVVHRIVGALNQ